MEIGQIITKDNYIEASKWCNRNNAKLIDWYGNYKIIKNDIELSDTAKKNLATTTFVTDKVTTQYNQCYAQTTGARCNCNCQCQCDCNCDCNCSCSCG